MSSMVRRLQKRMMKKAGLTRQTQRIEMRGGVPELVWIPKGQRPIVDDAGEKVGMSWPMAGRVVTPRSRPPERQVKSTPQNEMIAKALMKKAAGKPATTMIGPGVRAYAARGKSYREVTGDRRFASVSGAA